MVRKTRNRHSFISTSLVVIQEVIYSSLTGGREDRITFRHRDIGPAFCYGQVIFDRYPQAGAEAYRVTIPVGRLDRRGEVQSQGLRVTQITRYGSRVIELVGQDIGEGVVGRAGHAISARVLRQREHHTPVGADAFDLPVFVDIAYP